MDTDIGYFLPEAHPRVKQWMERISIGDVVELKGQQCEVVDIEVGGRTVTLKLMSSYDRHQRALSGVVNRHERRKAAAVERKR